MVTLLLFYQLISVQLYSKYPVENIQIQKRKITLKTLNKSINYPQFSGYISINNGKQKRYYRGNLSIIPNDHTLKLILRLPLHDYSVGVVAAEMGTLFPKETIKAFYLIVKHYTLNHLKRHKEHDFCDMAHCQLFYGDLKYSKKIDKIVQKVKNHWILYKGKPIETFYNAICGPVRGDPESIWGRSIPYITGGDNRYQGAILAKRSQNYQWQFSVDRKQFFQKTSIKHIQLIKDQHGYVKQVKSDHQHYSGENFRRLIGHQFGWNKIKSNIFKLKSDDARFYFSGYGFGHGIGFCIEEAGDLAGYGLNYQEIIQFFFKGVEIVPESVPRQLR